MSLTPQATCGWVAHLARLELTDAELETMTRQLSAILDYVDQLQQVNTEGVEPLAHAAAVSRTSSATTNRRRRCPLSEALANAPDRRTAARASILRRAGRAGLTPDCRHEPRSNAPPSSCSTSSPAAKSPPKP